jgi:hypothetical protein
LGVAVVYLHFGAARPVKSPQTFLVIATRGPACARAAAAAVFFYYHTAAATAVATAVAIVYRWLEWDLDALLYRGKTGVAECEVGTVRHLKTDVSDILGLSPKSDGAHHHRFRRNIRTGIRNDKWNKSAGSSAGLQDPISGVAHISRIPIVVYELATYLVDIVSILCKAEHDIVPALSPIPYFGHHFFR